jgi:hypothetical protein
MAEPVAELTTVGQTPGLRELADASVFTVFQRVASSPRGLTERDAASAAYGFGQLVKKGYLRRHEVWL